MELENLQVTKEEKDLILEALADYRQKGLKSIDSMQEKRTPEIYERIKLKIELAALLAKKIVGGIFS